MRKTAVIVIAVLLASCTVPGNIISGITSNPFSDSVDLTEPGVLVSGVVDGKMEAEPYGEKRTAEELTFPFVTDVHVDRTDSGVTDFTNEFISFLDGKDYPFTVCLGDLSDTGDYTRDHTASFISECQKRTNGNFVYVIGNHERHMHNESFWDEFAEVLVPSGFSPRMTRYEFGERGARILKRRKYDAAVLVEYDALSDGSQRLHVEAVLRPKHGVAAAELHRLVEGRLYARLAGGDEHGAQPRLARDDGCDVVADDHRAALYLQPVQQRPDLRPLVNGADLYAVVQQAAQDCRGARDAREAYDGEFFLVILGELDGLEDVAERASPLCRASSG